VDGADFVGFALAVVFLVAGAFFAVAFLVAGVLEVCDFLVVVFLVVDFALAMIIAPLLSFGQRLSFGQLSLYAILII
jgi:hypothetical protein